MASSARKLGGGRVLGSGRSLSTAVALKSAHSHLAISPSESSVSLSSQVSTQASTENQDISSRVSLDHGDPTAATNAVPSAKLVCPICEEEMVTLLQLNRHLDDTHQNLEAVESDEVKTWFRTQMVRAKRFQPLAVLNQKLKGLDTFEPNAAPAPSSNTHTHSPSHGGTPPPPAPIDPSDLVTRAHFQRQGTCCSDPLCPPKPFSPLTNPQINCHHCGRLFCEDHTMYQMKLSRSAAHEPVRGAWCRVCETCYKSREGYNDHTGHERDHTATFQARRRKEVDRNLLEVGRLEKRLTKLTQLLTTPAALIQAPNQPPPSGAAGLLWSLTTAAAGTGAGSRASMQGRKQIEQSVVGWEDDTSVSRCPFCHQDFSSSYNYVGGGLRRHHCRLCGRVVCGDSRTACSSEVGLDVDPSTAATLSEKSSPRPDSLPKQKVDIRMCRSCQHTIFFRRDFFASISPDHPPPSVRAYNTLRQFEKGIRLMLPKFQTLLVALQSPDRPPTPAQLAEASKTRKRLMDSFTQYSLAATRLRDLPTSSPTQKRLQIAVHKQASSFLHLHMLPLKTLPKILRHATSSLHGGRALLAANGNSPLSIESQSNVSSLETIEAEEKQKGLREQIVVLEEQLYLVDEMLRDAQRRRKFDEVEMLGGSKADLEREVDKVRSEMEGLSLGVDGARTPPGRR